MPANQPRWRLASWALVDEAGNLLKGGQLRGFPQSINRAELQALLEGLELAEGVVFHSDSQYVVGEAGLGAAPPAGREREGRQGPRACRPLPARHR